MKEQFSVDETHRSLYYYGSKKMKLDLFKTIHFFRKMCAIFELLTIVKFI